MLPAFSGFSGMSLTSKLPAALADVRRPGDFYTIGVFDWRAPALSVEGAGPVALPLLEAQARLLIEVAERAPFGRRAETVVDRTVRDCWQIDAERVALSGARWSAAFAEVVARAADGLGVEGSVEAIFYKLLIYEPGGFFVDHRDTEKCPGMFGTLIISPPGLYSGGELVIRHREHEARIDLRAPDPAEACFAAFYADCRHEVLPVEGGYRLALVYSLRRVGKGRAPAAPIYDRERHDIAALLAGWRKDGSAPEKIVLPLEHAYSPAEISFAALKGADQAAAKTLREAACDAGCDVHLALLTIEESGAAEHTGYSSRHSRWRAQEPEFEAGEVSSRDATLGSWRDASDAISDLPALPFDDRELAPPGVFEGLAPDEEYFGEATGNEGASFERTYRRAALVLWPRENFLSILASAELDDALAYLEASVERTASPEDGARAAGLADAIGERLVEASWLPRSIGPTPTARLLAAYRRLDHVAGVENCFERVLPTRGFEPQDVETLADALSLVAEARRAFFVERLMAGAARLYFPACAKLLHRLAGSSPAPELRPAAAHLLSAMPPHANEEHDWRRHAPKAEEIADMLAALRQIDESANARAAERLLTERKTYRLDAILVPALGRLAEQGDLSDADTALERLRAACLDHLRARAAEPLEPPADWRRASALGCKCGDCADLSRFLDDPTRKEFVLRAAEAARSHLEQTIRSAKADVDAKTLRQGRPYSLVCTKNRASYERRVVQRGEDLRNISIIEG